MNALKNGMNKLKEQKNMLGLTLARDSHFNDYLDAVIGSNKKLSTAMGKWLAEMMRGFTPDTLKTVQDYLLNYGWYMSGSFTPQLVEQLHNLIKNGKINEVEREMIDYSHDRIEPILLEIKKLWPERSCILKDAFNAHQQKLYTLSIPVILSQADGIFRELFGDRNTVFNKKKGIPKTKKVYKNKLNGEQLKIINDINSVTYLGFMRQLEILSSVAYDTKDVEKIKKADSNYNPLNRHGVMHGIDLNYDNEANSLRAILIIDYLEDIWIYFK